MKSEDSNQSMMALKLDHINSSWSQGMGVCVHNLRVTFVCLKHFH